MKNLYRFFFVLAILLVNKKAAFSSSEMKVSNNTVDITMPDLSQVYSSDNLSFSVQNLNASTVKWEVLRNETPLKSGTENSISFKTTIAAEYEVKVTLDKNGIKSYGTSGKFEVHDFTPSINPISGDININEEVSFTANAIHNPIYVWEIVSGQQEIHKVEDGNSALNYTFSRAGSYKVRLKVKHRTRPDLEKETEIDIQVKNPNPSTPFISTNDFNGIEKGSKVSFLLENVPNTASFTWRIERDNIDLGVVADDSETFEYRFRTIGEYQIFVDVDAEGNSTTYQTTKFTVSDPDRPPVEYSVIINQSQNGIVTTSASKIEGGKSVSITVAPNAGFRVNDIRVNGVVIAEKSSFTIDNVIEDKTVSVSIPTIPSYYTITINPSVNGTVTTSKPSVESGKNVSITVTPNEGFRVSEIKVNGVVIADKNSFTIDNVLDNKIIDVTFEEVTTDVVISKILTDEKMDSLIVGTKMSFTASVENKNYSWKLLDGEKTVKDGNSRLFEHTFSKSGEYDLILTVSNSEDSKKDTLNLKLQESLKTFDLKFNETSIKPEIHKDEIMIFLLDNYDQNLDIRLQWTLYKDNEAILSEGNNSGSFYHEFDEAGLYKLDVVATYENQQIKLSTESFEISQVLGSSFNKNSYEVYPNPTSNVIKIKSQKNLKLSLFDNLGKLIKSQNNSSQPMDVSKLNRGVYFLKIEGESQTYTEKILLN